MTQTQFGEPVITLFDLVTDLMTRVEKYRAQLNANPSANSERVREVDDHLIDLRELRNAIETWEDEAEGTNGEYIPLSYFSDDDPENELEDRLDWMATEYAHEYQMLNLDIEFKSGRLDDGDEGTEVMFVTVDARWVLDEDRLRDDIKAGEVIEVNLAKQSTPGYVYTISDHGNISLYKVELKEEW